MINDFSWLANEAKSIHAIFEGLFYSMATTLILIGVLLEYFKIPLGSTPSFGIIVSRVFIATIMLTSFSEVMDLISTFSDALAAKVGHLNNFKLVLSRMSDQLDRLVWSWSSVKQMVVVTISFVTFFLLYISVYFSDALYLYTWTLLYVFSPLLILMYILPATAGATKNLYKSLFMVASWKIVWSVMATLLWSAALMNLDQLGDKASFLTIVIFNIMLAASLLLTPMLVNALFSGGLAALAPKVGGIGLGGATYSLGKMAEVSRVNQIPQASSQFAQKGAEAGQKYLRNRAMERINKKAEMNTNKINNNSEKGNLK